MVQPVLAAKSLNEGQRGANFTGWQKILDVPLYILPGVLCLALFPALKNPDEAYMTMVTNLFPVGYRRHPVRHHLCGDRQYQRTEPLQCLPVGIGIHRTTDVCRLPLRCFLEAHHLKGS